MRIGITQRVELIESYGERRDCLDQEWTPLLFQLGLIPVPIPNRTEDPGALCEALGIEGLIFSGGNDLAGVEGGSNTAPERDACEAKLLDYAAPRDLPVLGVCRGMQMIVHHHGGRLSTIEGHIAKRHGFRVSTGAERIALTDRDEVNSFHGFAVHEDDVGNDLLPIGYAEDGSVEALVHRDRRLAAIMWHPERSPNDPRDKDLIRTLFLTRSR